ncbi:ArsR/SmtB family transcription factor [Streptomyces profundus]|uniref:ArsR/SmtB family transcription factor n=1 Tax=Streptomyces profundus TaxID=2867410 RepID=UPI001D16E821|nr:helix-turn-helix domain-containing protein [Streptomyces sp. MA3_2.13]UED84123.1 helix-turn-helix domain-containing protein [Streptomyces sp. MA3_2.13]
MSDSDDEVAASPRGPEIPLKYVELDAKGLRALAHPVRVRLVGLLRIHGPATATRLAQRLELTSGATSYHLRQLAAAGFVEEDTERGNGRDRWWRSVYQATSFHDRELAAREMDATLGYLRSIVASHTLLAQKALNELETMPEPWSAVVSFNDALLRLTPGEAKALRGEISEVIGRYRRYDLADENAPEDAERVSLVLHVLPGLDGADSDEPS